MKKSLGILSSLDFDNLLCPNSSWVIIIFPSKKIFPQRKFQGVKLSPLRKQWLPSIINPNFSSVPQLFPTDFRTLTLECLAELQILSLTFAHLDSSGQVLFLFIITFSFQIVPSQNCCDCLVYHMPLQVVLFSFKMFHFSLSSCTTISRQQQPTWFFGL